MSPPQPSTHLRRNIYYVSRFFSDSCLLRTVAGRHYRRVLFPVLFFNSIHTVIITNHRLTAESRVKKRASLPLRVSLVFIIVSRTYLCSSLNSCCVLSVHLALPLQETCSFSSSVRVSSGRQFAAILDLRFGNKTRGITRASFFGVGKANRYFCGLFLHML